MPDESDVLFRLSVLPEIKLSCFIIKYCRSDLQIHQCLIIFREDIAENQDRFFIPASRSSSASGMRPADTGTDRTGAEGFGEYEKAMCGNGDAEELDPFQTLSCLSLPVLPEIRITDRASLIPWNTGICRLVHHRLGLTRKKSCRFAWYQFQP